MLELPSQIDALPLIAPGWPMLPDTVTANVCAAEVPQALVAVTEIFPLVALATVVMELVVDIPVQPPGKTQV